MLITRVITGIIGIVVTILAVTTGGYWFGGGILLLALTGWHEYYRAFKNINVKLWYGGGVITVAFIIGCAWFGNSSEFMAVLTAALLIILARVVLSHPNFTIEQAAITVLGIIYLGLPFSHLLLLRFMQSDIILETAFGSMEVGAALIWTAFIGTWASDTFAYFTGRALGRHKLCPNVSPGKTVEGFAGGIIGTMAALLGVGMLFDLPLIHMAPLGVMIALVATLGDLVESSLKRHTGIKDSGSILPGHGGVLDRFDSILFTVPFVYYYVMIFGVLNK